MAVARQKQDLVGRILTQYSLCGREAPIGLAAASVEVLKRHLEVVRKSP